MQNTTPRQEREQNHPHPFRPDLGRARGAGSGGPTFRGLAWTRAGGAPVTPRAYSDVQDSSGVLFVLCVVVLYQVLSTPPLFGLFTFHPSF